MMYVVTTQGKSGSTLLAKMLHTAGIQMWTQPCDFNEEQSFREINAKILCSNHQRMIHISKPIALMEYGWLQEDVDKAIRRYSGSDFGFKSLLTIHTYDVLKKYLPEHKVIHIYRDPREIFQYRTGVYDVLLAWKYVMGKAQEIAGLFVNYNSINTDDLLEFTGRDIQNLFDQDRYHRKPFVGETIELLDECTEIYNRNN